MKSWLLKFRISSALDDRRPLPPSLRQAASRSEAARRFAANSETLGQALKSQLPAPESSPALHASIMRAVRTAAQTPVPQNHAALLRWMPAASLTAFACLAVFMAVEFPPGHSAKAPAVRTSSLTAASSALELGGNLVRCAPAAAMSPLSDEMARLDRDLASTRQFLYASLP